MCQLIFADLGTARFNSLFTFMQMKEDTRVTNKDGFGIFNGGIVAKSKLDASIVSNFGTFLPNNILEKTPVIAHVRYATGVGYGANYYKNVSDETAHPFQTDKLVLAHNGVLEFKDKKNYDKHKDVEVDSLVFLLELDSRYDGTNFIQAIQQTMELFDGTFAFLIYSKLENEYYICKGKTKKLHQSTITFKTKTTETKGLVLNTDKDDLLKNLANYKAVVEITTNGSVEFTEPVILEEESIYKLKENSLEKIGELKETEKVKTFFPLQNQTGRNTTSLAVSPSGTNNNHNPGIKDYAKTLAEFLGNYHISLQEFDIALFLFCGKGFFQANQSEMDKVMEVFKKNIKGFYTEAKGNIWKQILTYFDNPADPYTFYADLKFPYMLNKDQDLKNVLLQEQS